MQSKRMCMDLSFLTKTKSSPIKQERGREQERLKKGENQPIMVKSQQNKHKCSNLRGFFSTTAHLSRLYTLPFLPSFASSLYNTIYIYITNSSNKQSQQTTLKMIYIKFSMSLQIANAHVSPRTFLLNPHFFQITQTQQQQQQQLAFCFQPTLTFPCARSQRRFLLLLFVLKLDRIVF